MCNCLSNFHAVTGVRPRVHHPLNDYNFSTNQQLLEDIFKTTGNGTSFGTNINPTHHYVVGCYDWMHRKYQQISTLPTIMLSDVMTGCIEKRKKYNISTLPTIMSSDVMTGCIENINKYQPYPPLCCRML